jgi:CubicO group peptidase (beta-lactamase class C family)
MAPSRVVPRSTLLFTFFAITVATACDSPTGPGDELRKPQQTGDGWETASLESVGMDSSPLRSLLDLVDSTDNHLIHSLLIVKDQKLVFERYWGGADLRPEDLVPVDKAFDRNTLHYVASVSKSITSALAGIAMDMGLLGSVDEKLFNHFPEQEDLRTEDNDQITLRHLLSFSSGYGWNEFVYGFDDPRDSHYQMFSSQDPIRHLLGRPVVTTPGEVFHYNSGDTNLAGEILRRASSSSTLMDFAEERLWGPLGIDDYAWTTIGSASQVAFASGGVSLRPRDMAKFGALYLNGGVWNGVRIISQAWVDDSVEMAVPLIGNYLTLYGYGYNWWLGRLQFKGSPMDYFRAAGWGGQDIYVIPSIEMVIVFTAGGYYESRPLSVNSMIEDFIFEAVIN